MTVWNQPMRKNDHIRRYEDDFFKIREPFSALSHFAGFLLANIGMPVLLIRAAYLGASLRTLISLAVFMATMILLYGASASYHAFNISDRANRILKKADHMSIFVLIAGTYTPICMCVLPPKTGKILLIAVWGIGILGILFKAFFVYCPRWVSSFIYIAMGWAALSVFPALYSSLDQRAFLLLLTGGIFYTVGALIYAVKPNFFTNPVFGNHELFHLFVLAGSLCHYLLMAGHVALL